MLYQKIFESSRPKTMIHNKVIDNERYNIPKLIMQISEQSSARIQVKDDFKWLSLKDKGEIKECKDPIRT